ncbi:MAG: hypothetical protein GKS00_11585 [Alphaproteobacteria bacterium]|nr:hypothetical protein [Alphaproteobacteria bacterium]
MSVPENASLNYTGNGWICNNNFKRVSEKCLAMSAGEIKKSKERQEALKRELERRRLQGVSGDHCETEYKTGSEICVEISSGELDCNESYLGAYYDDCDVSLTYEVSTDYRGGSNLDVEIECQVEIEYSSRKTYLGGSDSNVQDESHSLYAHDSDSNTMYFNFSFGPFDEVTSAKVGSVSCEVESVDLY